MSYIPRTVFSVKLQNSSKLNQSASIPLTLVATPSQTGLYLVTIDLRVDIADGISSILGPISLQYTDAADGETIITTIGTQLQSNQGGLVTQSGELQFEVGGATTQTITYLVPFTGQTPPSVCLTLNSNIPNFFDSSHIPISNQIWSITNTGSPGNWTGFVAYIRLSTTALFNWIASGQGAGLNSIDASNLANISGLGGSTIINVLGNTQISYAIGYQSNTPGQMTYDAHVKVVYVGGMGG